MLSKIVCFVIFIFINATCLANPLAQFHQYIRNEPPPSFFLQILNLADRRDLAIHLLGSKTKEKYAFEHSLLGFAVSQDIRFRVRTRPDTKEYNANLDLSVQALRSDRPELFKMPYTVFITESEAELSKFNEILILGHELSHIFFTDKLNRNIEKMLGRFPSDLVFRDQDGIITIDSQLYSYLQERFANEFEFQLLLEMKKTRKFLPMIPPKWVDLYTYTFGPSARKQIAIMVRMNYKLSDIRLSLMDRKLLSELIE